MLALVAARLQGKLPLTSVAATLMEPASEHGRAAMDELHQQTVSLLSFQNMPKEQYDVQVAFNLVPALGEAAKVRLAATDKRVREHYGVLSAGTLPKLALQVVQAPVFHGYAASVLVEFGEGVTTEQVEAALASEEIELVEDDGDAPSNLTAAGQEEILVRVSRDASDGESSRRVWLWLAADNLKLGARSAISCALELRRLRPSGKVQ
jgi:aspartate-semialdehyde dehydrogenase